MRYEVGIDFGSVSSFVYLYRDNLPEVVCDAGGEIQIPSYVYFNNNNVIVGNSAMKRVAENRLVVRNVKRLIGRLYCSFSHEEDNEVYGTELLEDDNGYCCFSVQDKVYTVTDILVYILDYIRRRVNMQSGANVTNVTISVPINASNLYREIMKNAGIQAGWETIQFVNEPTAAVISQQDSIFLDNNILVFHFGDSYLCNTILHKKDDKFEILATYTDETINDMEIEKALLGHVEDEYKEQTKQNIWSDNPRKQQKQKATTLSDIQSTIRELSHSTTSAIDITRNNNTMTLRISQDCLNKCLKTIIQQIQSDFDYLLNNSISHLTVDDIQSILLVGDSSIIPVIRETVQTYFKKSEIINTFKNGELIAWGCGVCSLQHLEPDYSIQFYLHNSIGLVLQNQMIYPLFETGCKLPCKKIVSVTSMEKGVNTIDVQVVEMNRLAQDSIRIVACVKSSPFTIQPNQQKEITITFKMQQDGTFTIEAITQPGYQKCINVQLQGFSHSFVC